MLVLVLGYALCWKPLGHLLNHQPRGFWHCRAPTCFLLNILFTTINNFNMEFLFFLQLRGSNNQPPPHLNSKISTHSFKKTKLQLKKIINWNHPSLHTKFFQKSRTCTAHSMTFLPKKSCLGIYFVLLKPIFRIT